MPDGELRRPPQLWEQKLARTTAVVGLGVGGDATALVTDPPVPGTEGGVEPAPTLPPPESFSTPSAPTLTGGVQSIMVTWDGLTSTGDQYPYETAVVEVHQSTTTGFTPSSSTLKGELRYPGNFTITGLTAETTYYFKLRGRDAAGNFTTASAQASGTTGLTTTNDYGTGTIEAGAVSFNARAIGGITTTVGTTAPTSPLTGDIWLDSTGGSIVHKRWSGTAWVTQAWGSSSLSANCITATQIAAGAVTAGAILAGEVTAEKIRGDAIDGKVITGATFRTSATAGTSTTPRAGVILDTSGLRGFDASGNQTININASTGAVTLTGFLNATDVGSGGSTTIDGGRITTGFISGDRITGGTIEGATIQTRAGGSRIRLDDAVTGPYGTNDAIEFIGGGNSRAIIAWDESDQMLDFYANYFGVYSRNGGTTTFDVSGKIEADSAVIGSLTANTAMEISFSGGNRALRVASNGDVFSYGVDAATTANAANVRVCASAQLLKSTSTVRVKDQLVPVTDDLAGVESDKLADFPASIDPYDVLTVTPTEFRSLSPADAEARMFGFIAEDVATKLPWAANWDDDGIPSAVEDRPILAALLAVVRDQQQTITDLTARVTALEGA